jgi:methylated-DNA-[protein]-cysteine S-methyltransferase
MKHLSRFIHGQAIKLNAVIVQREEVDLISVYAEKVGDVWFGVAFEGESVYATSFASTQSNALRGLKESVRFGISVENPKKTKFATSVVASLKDIYDGKNVTRSFSLAKEHLPKYSKKVIETVCKVPLGYVATYGDVAKAVGGGPRAVGQVMASNPFAPVCPCHRVVRSDLTLGGYGGGLDVKLAFLKREKRGYSAEREIPVDGKKLRVFPVEFAIRKAQQR